jgi:glycosyltransferase involved in cell wall biosynthesis
MVLGMDATRMVGKRTGVGRYLEYLLAWWSAQPLPFERVELFSPAPIQGAPDGPRFEQRVLPSRGPGAWWQTTRLRRRGSGLDVLFAPYTIPPGYAGRSVVSNLGILEGPNRMPGLRARLRSRHFAYSARRADAVIANSETTKAGLVQYFRVPEQKITVVSPGVHAAFRPEREGEREDIEAAARHILGEAAPFLLYVGKLSVRRHVPELLEAFAEVAVRNPGLRMLFVGPLADNVRFAETVSRLHLEQAIRHIDYLERDELALLYRAALAFVLPTAQEGFSATILEALASGCPVLTVDHSALREAGLEEGVVALPDSRPETLRAAIDGLVDDEPGRRRLSERGPRFVTAFSWEENARRTMEILAEVAAQ